jgi:type IV secretory pathway TrbF-like protein
VVEIDKLGEAPAVSAAAADYRPTDPQIAWHLAHFIENVRAIPADPIIRPTELAFGLRLHHRQGRGRTQRLCPRQRSVCQGRPHQIAIEISSVIRAPT